MAWRRTRWENSLIRISGAVLLAIACTVARVLFAAPDPAPHVHAYLLALILFVAASAGSAMLVLGGHLLDPVPLSPRWTRRF